MGSSGAPLRLPHFDVRSGLTCPTDSFAVVTPVAIDRVRADHCERIVRVEGDPSRAVTSVGSKGASKLREAIEISRFHAHVYYEAATREVAERVREGLAQRFVVELGRWHEQPVGPHARPMYQVSFAPDQFDGVVPWLMLNRSGLSILVHPLTGDEVADHETNALWLGDRLPVDIEFLRRHAGA